MAKKEESNKRSVHYRRSRPDCLVGRFPISGVIRHLRFSLEGAALGLVWSHARLCNNLENPKHEFGFTQIISSDGEHFRESIILTTTEPPLDL